MNYFFVGALILLFCLLQSQTKLAAKQKSKPNAAPVEEKLEDLVRKAVHPAAEKEIKIHTLTNLKHPAELEINSGLKTQKVFLKFILDKSGKVTNAQLVNAIKNCKPLTEVALQVINSMPRCLLAVTINKKADNSNYLPNTFMNKQCQNLLNTVLKQQLALNLNT
jgi:hypothetical protein